MREKWEEDAYWVVKPETKEFLHKFMISEGVFPFTFQNAGPMDWMGSPTGRPSLEHFDQLLPN